MASSRRQADTATRFQVLLERLKSGEAKKMQAFLVEMDKLLRIRLGATEFQRSRIDAQLAQVAADLRYIRGQAQSELMPDLRGIAEYAAEFETRALGKEVVNYRVAAPVQVYAAALAKPLSDRKSVV